MGELGQATPGHKRTAKASRFLWGAKEASSTPLWKSLQGRQGRQAAGAPHASPGGALPSPVALRLDDLLAPSPPSSVGTPAAAEGSGKAAARALGGAAAAAAAAAADGEESEYELVTRPEEEEEEKKGEKVQPEAALAKSGLLPTPGTRHGTPGTKEAPFPALLAHSRLGPASRSEAAGDALPGGRQAAGGRPVPSPAWTPLQPLRRSIAPGGLGGLGKEQRQAVKGGPVGETGKHGLLTPQPYSIESRGTASAAASTPQPPPPPAPVASLPELRASQGLLGLPLGEPLAAAAGAAAPPAVLSGQGRLAALSRLKELQEEGAHMLSQQPAEESSPTSRAEEPSSLPVLRSGGDGAGADRIAAGGGGGLQRPREPGTASRRRSDLLAKLLELQREGARLLATAA